MTDKFQESLNLIVDKLNSWLDAFVLHLPNLVIAIMVIAIMFMASKYVKRGIRKIVNRFSDNVSVNKLISNIVAGSLVFLGFVLVLSILDLQQTVTSLLTGAGIVGLVAGLAFQDALSNTFAGVVISVKDLFNVGDHVIVNGQEGIIDHIGFRFTVLTTFQGQLAIIPNRQVIQNNSLNYTKTGDRRVDLECSVSYGDDLEKAKRVAIEAIESCGPLGRDGQIDFFYTNFGDSSIGFSLRFWLHGKPLHPSYLEARSKAIIAVKKAFDENDIVIPFPIRTMDFGIRGGKSLQKSLAETLPMN